MLFSDEGEVEWCGAEHMPNCTNNEGEWRGLNIGLDAAVQYGTTHLSLFGDSDLIIKQLCGENKVTCERLRPSYTRALERLSKIRTVHIQHRRRAWNTAADHMANIAADGHCVSLWANGEPNQPTTPPPACPPLADDRAPDIACSLLGIRPHQSAASLNGQSDWFQIIRMSVLRHLHQGYIDSWKHGVKVTEKRIQKRVVADLKRAILLRTALKTADMGGLRMTEVYRRRGLTHREVAGGIADFAAFEEW